MKEKQLIKYEISQFKPQWIDMNFPSDEELENSKDIVRFYLINSPCKNSSARGTNISIWGKPDIILNNKLKSELNLVKNVNYDYTKSKTGMKELFEKYDLKNDFTNITEDKIIFLKKDNIFDSIFRHIRNAIAHSRWQVKNDIYYFEDGNFEEINKEKVFCVTARIVLCKESLIKWRNLINSGPTAQELQRINLEKTLDDLIAKVKNFYIGKSFRKRDIVDKFGIDNNIWKKLYKKGEKDGILKKDKGNRWKIIEHK